MGSIYRAVQLSTDRPRAIKLLHPMLVEDELARERFSARPASAPAFPATTWSR